MDTLTYLGKQTDGAVADKPETVPFQGRETVVELDCLEFTSFCPVTSQPDFGKLVIRYKADKLLLETKSLKLYLRKFRDLKAFNEHLVNIIADEVWDVLKPQWLEVVGRFNARGGISVHAFAHRGGLRDEV